MVQGSAPVDTLQVRAMGAFVCRAQDGGKGGRVRGAMQVGAVLLLRMLECWQQWRLHRA